MVDFVDHADRTVRSCTTRFSEFLAKHDGHRDTVFSRRYQ